MTLMNLHVKDIGDIILFSDILDKMPLM